MTIRLYRSCTVRDLQNNYCLTSKITEPLTNRQILEEAISHELDASTGRGVFYSFSPDIRLVRAYHNTHNKEAAIAYVDVDLENLPPSVKGLYPIYLRDYLLCLMAQTQIALDRGMLINPATKRPHSLLGIVNTSQRSVSGWASSMKEICIQAEKLKLHVYRGECDDIVQDLTKVESELKAKCIVRPDHESINRLRQIIETTYQTIPLKNTYILERVCSDEWFVA